MAEVFPVHFAKFLRTPFFHRTPLVVTSTFQVKQPLHVTNELKDSITSTFVEEPDFNFVFSRSSHRRCSVKIVLLKILQNSQENIHVGASILINFQAPDYGAYTL